MTKIEDEQIHAQPWDTEVAAYMRLLKDVKALRGDVIRTIARYSVNPEWRGMTDREIDDICERTYGVRGRETYRKRRTELLQAGLVEASGEVRLPKTVNRGDPGQAYEQRVWRIAERDAVENLAKGDIDAHIRDAVKLVGKPKPPKAPPTNAMPSDTQSRLIAAQDALLKIKATLQEYRLNTLEDTLWRYACEGLGLDPAKEAGDD